MGDNREGRLDRIQQDVRQLPSKWKRAICWSVENWDLVKGACKGTTMTEEAIEQAIEGAMARDDAAMAVLLSIAKQFKERARGQEGRTDDPNGGKGDPTGQRPGEADPA